MERYISKSALVAEIKRRRKIVSDPILSGNDLMIGERNALFNLLSFIDTLEVKDIPSWKRATEDILIGCLVWDEQRHFHLYSDRVAKGELYISIADILRLPGSPRKE